MTTHSSDFTQPSVPEECRTLHEKCRTSAPDDSADLPDLPDARHADRHSDLRMNFFERIYDIVRAVPPGEVVSYGQVAFLAGNPRMARQVGWALHTCPADVPWHRVVRKDGTLPSFPGEGADRQRSLLLQEGVLFDENGRVERLHFGEPSDDTKSRMKSSRRRLSKHGESI